MPASFHEQFKSRDGSGDPVKGERYRRFYVPLPPDTAHTWPELPQSGDPFPGQPPGQIFTIRMDRYDVAPADDGMSIVTAVYTNDRSGRLNPAPDRTEPSFKSWSMDFQEAAADYPTVMTYPLRIPGETGSGGPGRTADTTIYKIGEQLIVWERSIVLTNVTSDELRRIGAQNNKIHKIGDRAYRFKAGRIHQTERTAWETVYTWIEDPGTPPPKGILGAFTYPANGGFSQGVPSYAGPVSVGPVTDERRIYVPPKTANQLLLQIAGLSDTREYVRSPFHQIGFELTKDMIPQFWQHCPYDIEANGWQNLPGNLGF
jgi:hypothetical protein